MASLSGPWRALASGLIGACTLTFVHETARRLMPNAPRMDVLGMRAIDRTLKAAGKETPDDSRLHNMALAGDMVANTLYYSLAGAATGKKGWGLGSLLGLGAGLGAVLLPGPMGLGREPSQKTPATQAMTIAWYLIGGLAAAAASNLLERDENHAN